MEKKSKKIFLQMVTAVTLASLMLTPLGFAKAAEGQVIQPATEKAYSGPKPPTPPVPPTPPGQKKVPAKTSAFQPTATSPLITKTPTPPESLTGEILSSSSELEGSQFDLQSSNDLTGKSLKLSTNNENTGKNSENNSSINLENDIDITNDNEANVVNDITGNLNTGSNRANYNTGNGSVVAGDANVVFNLINLINTAFVVLPGGQISFVFQNIFNTLFGNYLVGLGGGETYVLTGADVSNNETGPDSTNTAMVNVGSETTIQNNNNADIENNINLSANTGNNSTNYNTGSGSVVTGDANLSATLMNFVNSSFTVTSQGLFVVLNIFGDWFGDLLLPEQLVGTGSNNQAVVQAENQNTGSGSVSEAGVEISNSIDLENNNEADIQNNVQISSNTGNNSTNFNTGGGQAETGTTESQINIQTLANQAIISGGNLFYFLINVLGTWTGANLLSSTSSTLDSTANLSVGNENTGLNSTNTANIKSTDDLKITNNNQASLENNLNLSANTGNNQASYNTGNGIIKTGNTNIIASILNFVNLSLVTDKAIFLVVNVFGDWNGNINVQETETTLATEPTQSLAVTITSKQNGLANEFNFPLSESGFSTLDLSSLPPVNSGSSDSDPLVLGAKTGGGSGDSAQTNTTGSANSPATTRSLLLAFLVVVGGYVVGYGIGRVKKQLAINNKQ